ncbi:hypothetical protein GGQ22_15620 [Nocardioides sp. zg-579]|uniref:Uncharacterized protein n=1 Tax=Nocardioides marmotae TaxID=2663857 RepID=A0A6I3JEP7_9ACTN|nr:hypothetical protein [Nocardioides marmotae]MCR6032853.1 hypothetical protein [Gordonia jinghuaiqii]MTB96503.1 hypothetical protein [Nocardioides marmotae]QKE01975.1 hypothetical protein HPC71_13510 [Nocardioides marmotae]
MPSQFHDRIDIGADPAIIDPFVALGWVESECDKRFGFEKDQFGFDAYRRSVTMFFEGGTASDSTVAQVRADMADIGSAPKFLAYNLRQSGGELEIEVTHWLKRSEPVIEIEARGSDRVLVYGLVRDLSERVRHGIERIESGVKPEPSPEPSVHDEAVAVVTSGLSIGSISASTRSSPPEAPFPPEPPVKKHPLANPWVAVVAVPMIIAIIAVILDAFIN